MRINVYTEELIPADFGQPAIEVVIAEYVSSRTGQPMKNYGLRFYLKSHSDLHYIPGRDDDRSAVTFWCGSYQSLREFAQNINRFVEVDNLERWREKTIERQNEAEKQINNGS